MDVEVAGNNEVTVSGHKFLKDKILSIYLHNTSLNRKFIAEVSGASYGFVRKIISQYVRKEVTNRREPQLPFSVHGWFWGGLWRKELYDECGAGVVGNQNGMKRFVGESFTFLLHKNGRVMVCPFVDDERVWREELIGWLRTWVDSGLAEALVKDANLKLVGSKSYAVHAPGIVKKLNFRVKGFGSFKTDGTPYPDGTAEVEVDPKLDERLRNIEVSVERLSVAFEKIVVGLEGLGKSLNVSRDTGLPKPLERDYSI